MAVRIVPAAAVLAAAAVVYALVHQSRRAGRLSRQLDKERASSHLMAGCMARDLELFRHRLDAAMAQDRVAAAAGRVLDEALSTHDHRTPPTEGGTR